MKAESSRLPLFAALCAPLLGAALAGATETRAVRMATSRNAVRPPATHGFASPRDPSPPWIEQKVTASDGQADDQFGLHSVIDGDTALVSAPLAPGGTWQCVVYAFERIDGEWVERQRITASDAAPSNQFGGWLALVGDTAFIGAPEAPGVGGPDDRKGAAYVFTRTGGSWFQTQKLTLDDGAPLDQFGGVLAFDGTTAMISSNDYSNGAQGAVYVFTRQGGIWTRTQKITAEGDTPPGSFGGSLAVSGDTAFIAALNYNPDNAEGWVYVLERDTGGQWHQVQTIISPNATTGDYFGDSIAFNGTTALIGAPGTTVGENVWQGAVHVYVRGDEGTWQPTQLLTASGGMDHDIFGFVAMHGHTALVGAQRADNHVGAAYVFRETDRVWTEVQKLTPSDGVPDDYFAPGQIAISDTTAVVGAWGAAPGGNTNQGAAYFYDNDGIFASGFDGATPP